MIDIKGGEVLMNNSKKRYLTIEEIVSIPQINNIDISNDGENLAFVKKVVNWKDNEYKSYVWIHKKDNKKSYPLTSGNTESSSPIWSPDSKNIAYLSTVGEKDKEKNQIFIKQTDGYTGVQVTNKKEGVSSFKWSPDGKGFYFITKAKEDEDIKNRKEKYGDFEYIDKEYRRNCLYYIEIEKGIEYIKEGHESPIDLVDKDDSKEDEEKTVSCRLTDEKELHVDSFDISPNGEEIVFIATPSPNMEDCDDGELYILDIKTKDIKKINKKELIGGNIIFSPDGNKICYTRSIKEKGYYKDKIDDSILEIYNMNTGETTQPLEDFDSSITPMSWNDHGIIIQWQEKTNYRVGTLKENGQLNVLNNEDSFIWNFSVTKDGNHISYVKADQGETFELYLDGEKITDENSVFEGKLKSNKEVVSWKSSDKLEIEGVLSTPCDFDKNKKYPLLVVIHGGPTWASFPIQGLNKIYPIEQFIEKGFIVIEPNYRGSSGYGNEFLKANYKKLGIGDYDDVISGVDMLIKEGFVDRDKVGVMGWSQGGYISAFCSTYSDRFKAISVGAGISNWITYYTNTDIHQFTRMFLGDNPWNDPEIYKKTSPMTYIKSASTPTMIQHGEKDGRVPTPNAYELYQGLRDMDVDTELIIFKGMDHGPNKPGLNRAIMKQNLMWFSHYILGEELENFRTL